MILCYLAYGGSPHTQKWVKYFADKGHEIHLISHSRLDSGDLPNIKVHGVKELQNIHAANRLKAVIQFAEKIRFHRMGTIVQGFRELFTALKILRIICRVKPDVLHAHFVTTWGFWGALCGFHPYVLTAWGSDILRRPKESKLLRWRANFALTRADQITCDAEHMVENLVEHGAVRAKVRLINFGVDIQQFHPDQRDEKFREKLGIEPDAPIIISLRSLYPHYDVESLVNAVPRVLRNTPNAKFIIAGNGEQRSALQELASSLGVYESIKFPGWIPNHELPRYLASADIYVSTSLTDGGIAASTAEAMACELPVVITDFGDNQKWVKDGEGGFIVPLKNPDALADRMVYLLKHENVRKRFGKINRKTIEERNNLQAEMEKMERIYEELKLKPRS